MSRTDISLLLSLPCALDPFLHAYAALVVFVAGVVLSARPALGEETPAHDVLDHGHGRGCAVHESFMPSLVDGRSARSPGTRARRGVAQIKADLPGPTNQLLHAIDPAARPCQHCGRDLPKLQRAGASTAALNAV